MSDAASSGSSSGLFDLERRLHPIQVGLWSLIVYLVVIVGWVLVTGRTPRGMRDPLAGWLRFQGQTTGSLLLLTDRYPSFNDRH